MHIVSTNGKGHKEQVPATRGRRVSVSSPFDKAAAWLDSMVARADQTGPFAEEVDFSPDVAQVLLTRNDCNRALHEEWIAQRARDIADDQWTLNGETIIVSKDGRLNDGQHRCHAVVRAGKTIKTFMAFGLERDTRLTVDQGSSKMAHDMLAMHGEKDTAALAAATSMLWQYRTLGFISRSKSNRANYSEMFETLRSDPGIRDSLAAIQQKGAGKLGGRSLLAFCHYVFHEIGGKEAADDFMRQLIDGFELKATNPIAHCRNRLIEARTSTRPLILTAKAELIFRTWNAWRRGDTARKSVPIMGDTLPELES